MVMDHFNKQMDPFTMEFGNSVYFKLIETLIFLFMTFILQNEYNNKFILFIVNYFNG
jgi:hypothetical protein